jgi:hypothetical protein
VLDSCTGAADSSENGNQGEVYNGRYTLGPKGEQGRAVEFLGAENSYVKIKNNGSLDTKYSLSILMQINPAEAGILFNYGNDEYGLSLAISQQNRLKFRVREREKSLGFAEEAESEALVLGQWSFIAVTYDYNTGMAKIFVNEKETGKYEFATPRLIETSKDVRFGNVEGQSGFNYKGLMSCVQVYDRALTSDEISKKRQCPAGPGSPLAG